MLAGRRVKDSKLKLDHDMNPDGWKLRLLLPWYHIPVKLLG